ncbi:MAG: FKBP-type peptidyl-prolyl cis-trans isomerase [Bacteroidota bacterium]
MKKIPLLLVIITLVIACGGEKAPPPEEAPPQQLLVNEDDLLMRLSAYLSTDTSRAAQEQNAIVDYAIENLLDVQATNTGLFYEIIQQGSGDSIHWGDFLIANYRGYLLDGTVFADSYANKRPLDFYVGNMIDGWNEGLQLLQVGGKIRLLVPSHLGYKEEGLVSSMGRTIVAPHQVLVFEVEVLEKKLLE